MIRINHTKVILVLLFGVTFTGCSAVHFSPQGSSSNGVQADSTQPAPSPSPAPIPTPTPSPTPGGNPANNYPQVIYYAALCVEGQTCPLEIGWQDASQATDTLTFSFYTLATCSSQFIGANQRCGSPNIDFIPISDQNPINIQLSAGQTNPVMDNSIHDISTSSQYEIVIPIQFFDCTYNGVQTDCSDFGFTSVNTSF